jgi:hypothetical protein
MLLVGVYTCSGLGSGARETKTAVNSPIDVILFGTRVDSKAARIILCSCAFRITGLIYFFTKGMGWKHTTKSLLYTSANRKALYFHFLFKTTFLSVNFIIWSDLINLSHYHIVIVTFYSDAFCFV